MNDSPPCEFPSRFLEKLLQFTLDMVKSAPSYIVIFITIFAVSTRIDDAEYPAPLPMQGVEQASSSLLKLAGFFRGGRLRMGG